MKILGRYYWVPRYLNKRFWQRVYYYQSIVRRRSSWSLKTEGCEINLSFLSPYHHSIAQSMSTGRWETSALHAWATLCRQRASTDQVIYDIGGYNGVYGILAAKLDPSAKVYIYEPDPLNARQCRQNVELNRLSNRVEVREIALSDVEGMVQFLATGSSGAAIRRDGKYSVRSEKLDTQRPKPTIMKIDIEGAEADLLLSAPSTLKAKPPILLELHSVVPEAKKQSLWEEIKRVGYKIEQLPSDNADEPHYLLS
jgi:FkbM family methyltransferase